MKVLLFFLEKNTKLKMQRLSSHLTKRVSGFSSRSSKADFSSPCRALHEARLRKSIPLLVGCDAQTGLGGRIAHLRFIISSSSNLNLQTFHHYLILSQLPKIPTGG